MNNNNLNSNSFTFILDRIPNTMFRTVQVNLPGISVPAPATSYNQSTQYFPGSVNEFDTFQMTFVVDENLNNYEEIYAWLVQQRFPQNHASKNSTDYSLVTDGALVTMSNASNPNRVIKFKDMFPVSLSDMSFDTQTAEPITCTAEFRYSYFVLEPKPYPVIIKESIAVNLGSTKVNEFPVIVGRKYLDLSVLKTTVDRTTIVTSVLYPILIEDEIGFANPSDIKGDIFTNPEDYLNIDLPIIVSASLNEIVSSYTFDDTLSINHPTVISSALTDTIVFVNNNVYDTLSINLPTVISAAITETIVFVDKTIDPPDTLSFSLPVIISATLI